MKLALFLVISILISSCAKDLSGYGKVKTFSSDDSAFLFKVEGVFASYVGSSKPDKKHSLMNRDEVRLLNELLINSKLCLDDYNYPSYVITSKQERIYDITFANLIEQNYNAEPATPLTYYGRCT